MEEIELEITFSSPFNELSSILNNVTYENIGIQRKIFQENLGEDNLEVKSKEK